MRPALKRFKVSLNKIYSDKHKNSICPIQSLIKNTNIGIYVQEMYTYVNVRLLRLVVGSAQAGSQLFSSRIARYVIFK